MNARRKRIQKVVDLRTKELDKRVAELGERRAAEARARTEQENKRVELERASESRLKLTQAPLAVKSWVEANEWLAGRRASLEHARTAAQRAQNEAEQAKGQVLNARNDLKKVEVLSSRIAVQEEAASRKVERRLEDELSALRFRLGQEDER